jgi:hypothetical protein
MQVSIDAVRAGLLGSLRVLTTTLVAVALYLGVPAVAQAQSPCVRFEIASTKDTTFTFSIAARPEITAGRTGVVVDPRRRDALVARFTVSRVDRGIATAVITGQTTDVAAAHVALIDEEKQTTTKSKKFWIGLAVGAVAGLGIGASF